MYVFIYTNILFLYARYASRHLCISGYAMNIILISCLFSPEKKSIKKGVLTNSSFSVHKFCAGGYLCFLVSSKRIE